MTRLFCLAAILSTTEANAQLEFSVSPSPVGSGARAAGMADAFVAIADDATAASWNPAGLVQLERPEISIVGSFNAISEQFRSDSNLGLNSRQASDSLDINFLSVVYPLPFAIGSSNAVISLSYQRKFDFKRLFDVQLSSNFDVGGTPVSTVSTFDFNQSGGFSTISPSFAIDVTDKLAVGVSFNLWRSSFLSENGWEKKVDSTAVTVIGTGDPQVTTVTTLEKYTDFEGENYSIGVLWQPSDKMSFGLRYETAFTGKIDFEGEFIRDGTSLVSIEERRKIHFPDSITLGAAYRFNDRLTVALSVSRTDWNDLYVERASGARFSLVDGVDLSDTERSADFDATYTVRVGAEYALIPRSRGTELKSLWILRGGLFFDQEPASGRSLALDNLRGDGNADDFYGITAGVGLLAFQRFNFDVAYQFRYGNDVNSDFIGGVRDFSEDYLQHRLLISTVIYF